MSESQNDIELFELRAQVRDLEQKVRSLEAQLATGAAAIDTTTIDTTTIGTTVDDVTSSSLAFADAWDDVSDEIIGTFFDAEYVDERARSWLLKDGAVATS